MATRYHSIASPTNLNITCLRDIVRLLYRGHTVNRLTGGTLWEGYASVRSITPQSIGFEPNPATLVTDFIADMHQRVVPEHLRKVAILAVQQRPYPSPNHKSKGASRGRRGTSPTTRLHHPVEPGTT